MAARTLSSSPGSGRNGGGRAGASRVGRSMNQMREARSLVMLDHGILVSVAEQMMSGTEVLVEAKRSRVTRTGTRRFRTVKFNIGEKEYQAIEQNAEKPSRWGKLAREGHRVVQVRDLQSGKYVAAVVDEKVTEYSR